MSDSAIYRLSSWLSSGVLRPNHESYAQRIRDSRVGFYATKKKEDGVEAAEALLSEEMNRRRIADFANGIEPVARGMLAMARVETASKYTRVYDPGGENLLIEAHAPGVIVFNTQVPGCGCSQPRDSHIFGPSGSLGLIAVSLEAAREGVHTYARLQLILPMRGVVKDRFSEVGFVAVDFSPDGSARANSHLPILGRTPYIEYAFGLAAANTVMNCLRSSGPIDSETGIPGADAFFADHLSSAGTYLTNLASALSGEHNHGSAQPMPAES